MGEEKIVETPTKTAADAQSVADKAAKKASFFDEEFEASLQVSIDKDAGKEPVKSADQDKKTEIKIEAVKTDATTQAIDTKPKPITDDLPSALLKKQEPLKTDDAKKDVSAEERQKLLDEQTKGMTPKAAERFKKIESRAYEAEQRAKALEAEKEKAKLEFQKQIEEAKITASKSDNTEVLALKKQLEELDSIVSKAALVEHPAFKARYDNRIIAEIERVKKSVPQDVADELIHLLTLPESTKRNEQVSNIADKLDGIATTKVMNALDAIDRLQSERAAELTNWKENKIHLEADQVRKSEIDSAKLKEIQDIAWSKGVQLVSAPDSELEVFQKITGEEEWNAAVDERLAKVKKIFTNPNIPHEAMVEIMSRAIAAEDYRRMYFAQRVLVAKQQEELAALKSASPTVESSSGGDAIEDNDDFITAAVRGSVKAGAIK